MYQIPYRYVAIWILNIFSLTVCYHDSNPPFCFPSESEYTKKNKCDSYQPHFFPLKSECVKSQVWLIPPHKVLQRRDHEYANYVVHSISMRKKDGRKQDSECTCL